VPPSSGSKCEIVVKLCSQGVKEGGHNYIDIIGIKLGKGKLEEGLCQD